jgi:hypothetical protein
MNIPFDSVTSDHFLSFQPNRHVSRRSRRQSLKNEKTKAKKPIRKTLTTSIKINPSFHDAILNALQGVQTPLKQYPRHLRFTAPPSGLHYYRTLTEWIETIKQGRLNSKAFPFTRPDNEALENHFRAQQILRRFMERCTRKQILKAIEAREHDDCDLYTTEPIPARSMVVVYDITNRMKYTFHTQTAIKMLQTSLQYSSYGIASPNAPKNPYTNVPWTVSELTTILKQIAMNLLNNHQFPPKQLQEFRQSGYCHKRFYVKHKKMLDILAAETFFAQKGDAYRDSVYEEIIDDNYTLLRLTPRCTALIMSETKLSASLKKEWDAIVLASFLETNLNTFADPYRTSKDILMAFTDLHERTLKYRRSLRAPIFTRTYYTNRLRNIIHAHLDEALETTEYAEENTDANWLQAIQTETTHEAVNESSDISVVSYASSSTAPIQVPIQVENESGVMEPRVIRSIYRSRNAPLSWYFIEMNSTNSITIGGDVISEDLEAPSVVTPSVVAQSVEAPSVEAPSVEAPSLVTPSVEAESNEDTDEYDTRSRSMHGAPPRNRRRIDFDS